MNEIEIASRYENMNLKRTRPRLKRKVKHPRVSVSFPYRFPKIKMINEMVKITYQKVVTVEVKKK
jgi:hypothetical protein